MRRAAFNLAIVCLVVLISQVKSQDDEQSEDQLLDNTQQIVIKDFNPDLATSSTPKVKIDQILPSRGPITGDTRVVVRGGPFGTWQYSFPKPVCKFGDQVVNAAYITCFKNAVGISDKERSKKDRQYVCLACESSPDVSTEGFVKFQVSLTGDFSDSINSVDYEYYPQIRIEKIVPRYGPKDGGTPVKIWGKNFKDYNGTVLVSFGTKSVLADVKNSTYMECFSPESDVVQKAMPVSISQNGGQFTTDTVYFWYYNWPQITELEPVRGPEAGGTMITIKGRNFSPFRDILWEVDNSPDVFCGFTDLKIRMPAKILSTTTAQCLSPPSYYWHQSRVELTLNSVEYTEDEQIFYFYKPPLLYDVSPREGPLKGGTVIKVAGTGFADSKEIKCKIGDKIVPGKFVNTQEIQCIAPMGPQTGYVEMKIATKPNLWSTPIKYLYYETPLVTSIGPICGPDHGYTQIEVRGQNFVDLGSNKAMCVFNKTTFTNATVMDDTLLYCDSPPYLNAQGYSRIGTNGDNGDFYNVQVTMDGGVQVDGHGFVFNYYKQPKIMNVYPFGGPLGGNTQTTINVTNLDQKGICDLKVRFSTIELQAQKLNNGDQLQVLSPQVGIPGSVIVQVTFNGQQYSTERIINNKDPLSSFEYYSDPIITYHFPSQGPTTGNTKIRIQGNGISTFIPQDYTGENSPNNRLWGRFIDPVTRISLAPAVEIPNKDFNNAGAIWFTPPLPAGTQCILQISRNNVDWHDVKNPNSQIIPSFQYYESPHITQISPAFGPVKDPQNTILTLTGTSFNCPENDCSNLKVKFYDNITSIVVPGTLVNSLTVTCQVPSYTKPDVLRVEVTFNGADYTSDNRTYGYFDPYIIDAQPRLIAVNGTTKITIKGLGFVDSGQIKVSFNNISSPITCSGGACMQVGTFLDQHTVLTNTLPQNQMIYKLSNSSLLWDPFTVGISVYNDKFNDNNIQIHYYQDIQFQMNSPSTNPANIVGQIKVIAKIDPADRNNLKKYSKSSARFTAQNGVITYSECELNLADLGGQTTDQLVCKTPVWNVLNGNQVKMDFSVNGYDYSGNFDYTFTDNLVLNRIVPMAGPFSQSKQNTRLIGQGFKSQDASLKIDTKWGPISTQQMERSAISSYNYKFNEFLNIIPGDEELKCYWNEADQFPRVDSSMIEGNQYDLYSTKIQSLTKSLIEGVGYETSLGGPFYVEVGRDVQVSDNSTGASWVYYDYEPSSVEYYYYKQCTMLQMHPTHGLTIGGTQVQVSGFDFRYFPEYGVVPHCKFGDQIVRGYFDSSVRIVCTSPPSEIIGVQIGFEVSLNGYDWTDSGFTFSYFREPEMLSYYPDSGQASGGTAIYIQGKNFPRITNTNEFNARFTPQQAHMAAKIMPVEWLNDTTLKVMSPGGWSEGDRMSLQLTFNGQDYDNNNFTFTMYKISQIFPKSGPSNGLGGEIVVKGQGFREDLQPLCRLNGTVYQPIGFNWTAIRCPMVKALDGDDFFGNVDFSVSANGGSDWQLFAGGFQYYQQPEVYDIFPKSGPAQGLGVVNFYGSMFRNDYANSQLSCRIGSTVGTAVFVNNQQIRCVVEDMIEVIEGQKLSAQVALNDYSWTTTNDDMGNTGSTFFVPYSISAIFPNSGSSTGGSEVVVIGSGFVSSDTNSPRCRFGTPSKNMVVKAEILSYNKISCVAPPVFALKTNQQLPFETPISIALTDDSFDPWTETYHRFRYFKQPVVSQIYPQEVAVGLITEVIAVIDPTQNDEQNIFFQPMPSEVGKFDSKTSISDDIATALLMTNQIKCRFGRFGETQAVFINSTAIKCVTPSVPDEPDDIYREKTVFSIAMNGYDYDDDNSNMEFTFVGTGSALGLLPYVIGIFLLGVLAIAIILFVQQYYQYISLPNLPWNNPLPNRDRPNVDDFGNGNIQQRALRMNPGSRGASAIDQANAERFGQRSGADSSFRPDRFNNPMSQQSNNDPRQPNFNF